MNDRTIKELAERLKAENVLLSDVATAKEVFIIDQLQEYMDTSDMDNPKWIEPVRLRLQEKKDWESKFVEVCEKYKLEYTEYEDENMWSVVETLIERMGL